MRKIVLPLTLLASTVPILQAAPAQAAGANRTFVSATGSDTNPCTFISPCRTFQAAYNATAAGGEIDVLDPAGYGTLTISKSISIQGHGYAGISTSSGTFAITINGSASDQINLRGLLIDGVGIGARGIHVNTGVGSLNIQECVIRNFTTFGIAFGVSGDLFVSDTLIADMGGSSDGISIQANAAVTAVLNRVQVEHGSNGIVGLTSGGTLNLTVVDSVVSANSQIGISASQGAPIIMIKNSTVSNNGTGIEADGTSVLRIGHSIITANTTGWATNGGTVESYGDNNIDNNAAGNTAPSSVPTK